MKIIGLDLATVSGFCYGDPDCGEKPIIGHWDLRSEHKDLIPGNLAYQLRQLFKKHGPPDFMAIEKTMNPFGQPSAKTIQSQERLHGAALGIAGMYRVPRVLEVAPATIRVHFVGKASFGSTDKTKAAVFKQARLLGYAVATLDEADSVALYDYVVHVVLRKPLKEVRLFRP